MDERTFDGGGAWTAEAAAVSLRQEGEWELWDGALVVREPAGGAAGPIGARLGALLHVALGADRSGWIGDASMGFVVRRGPDRVLAPDVSWRSRERLPRLPARGFAACTPELVAEIRSPRDSWTQVVARGGVWLAEGAKVVWLVDPLARRAATLCPKAAPIVLGPDDALDAAPALPGVSIALADLFAILDD